MCRRSVSLRLVVSSLVCRPVSVSFTKIQSTSNQSLLFFCRLKEKRAQAQEQTKSSRSTNRIQVTSKKIKISNPETFLWLCLFPGTITPASCLLPRPPRYSKLYDTKPAKSRVSIFIILLRMEHVYLSKERKKKIVGGKKSNNVNSHQNLVWYAFETNGKGKEKRSQKNVQTTMYNAT